MWEKLIHFVKNQPSKVLGIDIGTGSIKIACISSTQGNPKITQVHVCDLPPDSFQNDHFKDIDLLADLLRRELGIAGISANHAVTAVSGRMIFTRQVSFPVMKKEELQEAVRWDIEKYVPYPPESYYYDFAVLNERPEKMELELFLVAAPQTMVDGISDILRKAGLTTLAIDIEPLAIYRTMEGGENSLLVDIGAEVSHITVFQNGRPILARTIPVSGRRFTEDVMRSLKITAREAENIKKSSFSNVQPQMSQLVIGLVSEIHRTVEYFQVQKKQISLEKLFLSGGGSRLSNLKEQLEKELDMPILLHDPFKALEVDDSFDLEYIRSIAPQMAVAVGLAMRGGEL